MLLQKIQRCATLATLFIMVYFNHGSLLLALICFQKKMLTFQSIFDLRENAGAIRIVTPLLIKLEHLPRDSRCVDLTKDPLGVQ